MQTLYVTQFHCKQGDYTEKARVEMLFHLNSRLHWELSATNLQIDNRSSARREHLFSLPDLFCNSLCIGHKPESLSLFF